MSKRDFIVTALQPNGDIDLEATVGVFSPPVSGAGPTQSREVLELDETAGNRFPGPAEYGGRIFEGDIEGAARPNSFPLFLTMALGEPTTTEVQAPGAGGTTPGVYKHVWKPAAANKRPMPASLWVARQDPRPNPILDKFVGAKANTLAVNVETNGYLLFTAGLAIKRIIENPVMPSLARDATRKWSFVSVLAKMAVGANRGTDANLVATPLTSYGFTYGNNLVTDLYQLGSDEVVDMPEGNVDPSVTFNVAKDLDVHYRRALKKTPEDVRLVLTATGPTIVGAHKYEMGVDLKRLQYVSAPAPIDAASTLRGVEVTATPVLDDTANDIMEVFVVNDLDGSQYRAPVV